LKLRGILSLAMIEDSQIDAAASLRLGLSVAVSRTTLHDYSVCDEALVKQ